MLERLIPARRKRGVQVISVVLLPLVLSACQGGCNEDGAYVHISDDAVVTGPATVSLSEPGVFTIKDVGGGRAAVENGAAGACPTKVAFAYEAKYERTADTVAELVLDESKVWHEVESPPVRRLEDGSCVVTELRSAPLALPIDPRVGGRRLLKIKVRVTTKDVGEVFANRGELDSEVVADGATPAPPTDGTPMPTPTPAPTKVVKAFVRDVVPAKPAGEAAEPVPTGVNVIADSGLVVTDVANEALSTFDRSGTPAGPFEEPFRPVLSGSFPELTAPTSAAQLRDGRFAVTDPTDPGGGGDGRVLIYDPAGVQSGQVLDPGAFTNPTAVTARGDGKVVVGDADSVDLYQANEDDSGFEPSQRLSGSGGATAVAFVPGTDRVLAVGTDARVRSYDVDTVALDDSYDTEPALTAAGQAALSDPAGIAVDPTTERVWVTDASPARVIGFSPDLSKVEQVITTGAGAGEPLVEPRGIAIDAGGALSVADAGDHRVAVYGDATMPARPARSMRRSLQVDAARTEGLRGIPSASSAKTVGKRNRIEVTATSGSGKVVRDPKVTPGPGFTVIGKGLRMTGRLGLGFKGKQKLRRKLPKAIRKTLRTTVAGQFDGRLVDAGAFRPLLAQGRLVAQRRGHPRDRACFKVTSKATTTDGSISTLGEPTPLSFGTQTLKLTGGTGIFRRLKLTIRTPPYAFGNGLGRSAQVQLTKLGKRRAKGLKGCKALVKLVK